MIQSGPRNGLLDVIESSRLLTGRNAVAACGMQDEFANQLTLMQKANKTTLILRAGAPPVYDRPGAPKTGENLSKTSNQGFFKGRIAAQKQFTRIKNDKSGIPQVIGHHKKDAAKLLDNKQNTVQLPVRLKDIIRELREPGGDLKMLSYDAVSGEMHFQYKPGKGDPNFKGDFVINVKQGTPYDAHYSRVTDRPDLDPQFDATKGIIRKPHELDIMSDNEWEQLYKQIDNQEFNLFFTNPPENKDMQPATVFANKQGLIIVGDWDGLASGHPPNLPEYARKVYNTFAEDPKEQSNLIEATGKLLEERKAAIIEKQEKMESLNDFEKAMLKVKIDDLYDDFSVSRAGCITAHEFLNNSMANYLYREQNADVRDQSQVRGYQASFDVGLLQARSQLLKGGDLEQVIAAAKESALREYITQNIEKGGEIVTPRSGPQAIDQRMQSDAFSKQNANVLEKMNQALEKNIRNEHRIFTYTDGQANPYVVTDTPKLPHPDLDINLQNPFQHGYDMRNPYGSNLEGAWLMINDEGMQIHGNTQEQLVQVMLSDGFLEKNHIDVNFAADMSKGWGKVVERQIELGQQVPGQTMGALRAHQEIQKLQKELNPSLRMGAIPEFITNSPILRRAKDKVRSRSSSFADIIIDPLAGKSKDKIADETGKQIEKFSEHRQNIPEDLMRNYMDKMQNDIKTQGKLTEVSMKQIEVLLEHHEEMDPLIPPIVMQAYMQQNPVKAKVYQDKGIDFPSGLLSNVSGQYQNARLQGVISQLASANNANLADNNVVRAQASPSLVVGRVRSQSMIQTQGTTPPVAEQTKDASRKNLLGSK